MCKKQNSLSPFVSIVIPCYNVESYVGNLIDSIQNAKFENWEAILVDDGSKDATPNILDKYAESDCRVRVIHQDNGGVSKARNTALDYCRGTWITFIDSDDWYMEDGLDRAVDLVQQLDSDVIQFNNKCHNGNKIWSRGDISPRIISREGKEIEWFLADTLFPYYDFKCNGYYVGAIRGVANKFIRSEIIRDNHIRFEEEIKIAEDAMFNHDVFKFAKKVTLINEYIAYYRIHCESVMQKYNPNIVYINQISLNGYLKRIENKLADEKYRIAFQGAAAEALYRALRLYIIHPKCELKWKERKEILRKMLHSNVYEIAFSYDSLSYLPHGKREMFFCAKKGMYNALCGLASFSVKTQNIINRYK